jgi:hypothetical protein
MWGSTPIKPAGRSKLTICNQWHEKYEYAFHLCITDAKPFAGCIFISGLRALATRS